MINTMRNFCLRSYILVTVSLILLFLAACGSNEEALPAGAVLGEPLLAEVCLEGEGRKAKIYFKNLGDFEWRDVEFSIAKGGESYTFLDEPQSKLTSDKNPAAWAPEKISPAYSFDNSAEFTRRGVHPVRKDNYSAPLQRLTSFAAVQGASVKIKLPYPAEWTGEIKPCN